VRLRWAAQPLKFAPLVIVRPVELRFAECAVINLDAKEWRIPDGARLSRAIERQLARYERNKVRAAYNYAQYLPERRRIAA
jgi:hypothetical protein